MKKIMALGIGRDAVRVDAMDGTPFEQMKGWVTNPAAGRFPGLAQLVGDKAMTSRDAGVLEAADPVNSGMTDGKGMVTGFDWLLTVVAPENLVERVVRIVKESGGYT